MLLEDYLKARSPGNIGGLKPLAITTTNDIRSALRHLSAHLERPLTDILLGDVDPDAAHAFRTAYLRDNLRLGHKTIAKHVALLVGLWRWAAEERLPGSPDVNPWVTTRLVPRSRAQAPEEARTMFSPEDVAKLLKGLPRGDRLGDLFRLLLVTGCRVDEVARLPLSVVEKEEGFTVSAGKTVNASRWVPVLPLRRVCSLGRPTRGRSGCSLNGPSVPPRGKLRRHPKPSLASAAQSSGRLRTVASRCTQRATHGKPSPATPVSRMTS